MYRIIKLNKETLVFDGNLIDKRRFKYLKNSIWSDNIDIAKTLI